MAGGVGSRFWPLSVPEKPKQFLDVLGIGKSLLQMTFERLQNTSPSHQIYIVTNELYLDLVKEQLPNLPIENILCEPKRKNTAPCIAYAASKIYTINPEANLVIAPSDHLILKEERFNKIIKTALTQAEKEERLVTLGIKPTRPDTGYGYIEFVEKGDIISGEVRAVKHFAEKPNKELAEIFLKSGNYYWNSGIFIWKAKTIINALKKFKPELINLFGPENGFYGTADEISRIQHAFEVCEDISIDFAVMENAKNVDVVLANFDWSDLGTWGSLNNHLEKDYNNNAVIGGQEIHLIHSSNCIVNLPKDKVAIIDSMHDYVIVEDGNRLMILNLKNEQNLKKYLELLDK
jgi:mannose-1-phosphate guanylyltransferase